ncbi:MAG: porin family protein [Spirochaetes bacterium]|nr:porin family protein [Spirochaetota bacterium]
MPKKAAISILLCIFIQCVNTYVFAQRYFGVGIHIGAQHDVGDLTSFYPDAQTEPQNSAIFGVALRLSVPFFFIRTGGDASFTINKGKVLENQATVGVSTYNVAYTMLPIYAGLQFPLQDRGAFYLGGGASYFYGTGKAKLSNGTSEDIDATAFGVGFLAGMQLHVTSSFSLYMEWMYVDARSKPVIATTGTYNPNNYKDLFIDYSGHRIMIGVMYYVL